MSAGWLSYLQVTSQRKGSASSCFGLIEIQTAKKSNGYDCPRSGNPDAVETTKASFSGSEVYTSNTRVYVRLRRKSTLPSRPGQSSLHDTTAINHYLVERHSGCGCWLGITISPSTNGLSASIQSSNPNPTRRRHNCCDSLSGSVEDGIGSSPHPNGAGIPSTPFAIAAFADARATRIALRSEE